ncbi:MAG: hypothetical protein LBL66_05155 [Clostridiales bacterium]|jgi:hypothetical protein|nr:hypothetical protein [Clostridiales bacterium]
MRIISNFKDYYDFAGFAARDGDYRETVYLRKPALKVTDVPQEYADANPQNYYGGGLDAVTSKWWTKNKKVFSLPDTPGGARPGCLFVCGKAYPFLFLRGAARIGADGKGGQIRFSKYFNDAIKDSIAKKREKHNWERDRKDEDEFNFFRVYYSMREFFEDATAEKHTVYYSRRYRSDNLERDLTRFFDFYEGKDFTELHLRLDCPIFLTLFQESGVRRGDLRREYEFVLNPNLYEFDFARVMSGDILAQELDMFLGNALVKDSMPLSYQSDIDKLTAYGFDAVTSFRTIKDKK